MNNQRTSNYFLLTAFLNSVSLTIPLIIIGAPVWVISLSTLFCFLPCLFSSLGLFVTVSTLYNLLIRPGLYVWAFIIAASTKQDYFTILFYIATIIQIPSILKNIITYVVTFFKNSSK